MFESYRAKVPIYGCILLNPELTRCVLVQSINGTRWGFPKGKINENEPEFQCAVREVLEEVGVDVGDRVQENDVISTDFRGRKVSFSSLLFLHLEFHELQQIRIKRAR